MGRRTAGVLRKQEFGYRILNAQGILGSILTDCPRMTIKWLAPQNDVIKKGKKMRLEKIVELFNVAKPMSNDALNKICSDLLDKFNKDKSAREDKDRALEKAEKIAKQTIEHKSFPFDNASNVKYPLITKAVIEFNSRISPIICNNGEPVKIKTFGDKQDVAADAEGNPPEISAETGIFKTVQEGILERAKKVKDVMNWILSDVTDWESEKDRLTLVYALSGFAASKNYFDYTDGLPKSETVTPLCLYWEEGKKFYDASRKWQIISMPANEVIGAVRSGAFVDREGFAAKIKDDDEVKLLECHCWLDLDDDGYKEPYIVVIAEDYNQILRITPRFKLDDVVYNQKGQVVKIKPREYFVFYEFMPCPDGSVYPLGLCDLLQFINEAINTNINQMIDSGTLCNMQGGFISGSARIRGGKQTFNMGEFKYIDGAGLDIQNAIIPLPTKEPSAVLFQLLGTLIDAGNNVAMLSDVLTGDINPNMQPTTVLALIEQGLSGFKAILKRLNRSMKMEMRLVYDMIRENMFYLQARHPECAVLQDLSAGDFADDYAIIPVSDEYYSTSLEKSQRAQFFLSLAMSGNPYINGLEATTRALKILGVENADDLIIQPQPQQPDPLMMAQLQALNADIERKAVENRVDVFKALLEKQRTDSETINNTVKTQSETVKRDAEAINALANAESKEAGINNPAYIRQAKDMNLFTNQQAKEKANDTTNIDNSKGIYAAGLQTMEGQRPDANILQVSGGQEQ